MTENAENKVNTNAKTDVKTDVKTNVNTNTDVNTNKNAKVFGFQAEVKELLHLMIHSLYSNKEIFLRELISNASDAADKLRFESLRNPMVWTDDADLKIWVEFDKDAKTITVRDNGIGMTAEEVIQNLGTIAKSGTKEFLKTLSGDKAKDAKMIGQFGVGFYSAFIVADKVTVTTRKAHTNPIEATRWVSDGKGEYQIEKVTKERRGTEVVLHLKQDEDEFLNEWRLKTIITKYSDHITLPIMMKDEKGEEAVVNRAQALWTLPKSEIKDEQYKELYKHVAHDFEDPLLWSHNKVEGKLEYTMLLYIPSRAPFDLWQIAKPRGLKLYVQRVFIMDDAEQFLPHYLRFVRGVIDSNDLPLNISRELLQGNRITDAIRTAVIKRVLGMLEQLSTENKEKYQKFWKEFGQVLKEGPAEDFANKEQIAKLLRFTTTKTDTEEQTVSLVDYVNRMKPGQNKIYFVTGETFQSAQHSPHLEIFRKKGIEVLLLSDRVDEWLTAHLHEFQGKTLQSVARGGLELSELGADELEKKATELKQKMHESEYADLIKRLTDILGNRVKEVRLSNRLTSSPACVVLGEQELTSQMEKMLRAAGQQVPERKPILEINPEHPLMHRIKSEQDAKRFETWASVLLDQAILAEGGQLPDPATFVKKFNDLLLG